MALVTAPSIPTPATTDETRVTLGLIAAALAAVALTASLVALINASAASLTEGAASAAGLGIALMAPLGYLFFIAAAKTAIDKVGRPAQVRPVMIRASIGLLPWIVLTLVAVAWTGGPRQLLVAAAVASLPIAACSTIVVRRA